MAIFTASNLKRNIPEEGQVFSLSTAPGYVFKRQGEGFLQLNPEDAQRFGISAPKFGISYGDLAQSLTGGFQRVTDPTPFRDTRITPGGDISAIEQTLRAQGLPPGSPVPGLTPGANILAQPGIAPRSTLGVIGQSVADIQRRVDELRGKPITTASVAPTVTPPFVSAPTVPAAPSVSDIVASTLGGAAGAGGAVGAGEPKLTDEQQKAQTIIERVQKINLELAGKPTSELEQQKAEGRPEFEAKKRDLTSQLLALDAQSKAIPLQMQEQARGRGITAAGLAPIETAALRTNAIQALLISAQLNAIDGKISTANFNVEQAIKTKYAPIEAERDALIANLELAQKSPVYTVSEKKQAAELLIAQNQLKNAEAKIKKNEEETEKERLKYAPLVDDPTFELMKQAGSAIEVARIAREAGFGSTADRAVGDGGDGDLGTFINEFGETIQATNPPKAPVSGEQTSFVFFQRMKDAMDIINAYPNITLDENKLKQALLNQNYAIFQTSEQQIIAQAMRQFTEARLRKDSGAAIPESEFINDRRTYFPQVGETNPVLQRKTQARENALNALRGASGNAYWNFYGQNPRDVGQRILRGESPQLPKKTDEDIFDSALLGFSTSQSTPATEQIGGFFSQLWNSILGR